MKYLIYIFSSIWRLWFFVVFIIVFFCAIPGLFFFTAIYRNNLLICHITRYWSKLTLWFSFIFPKIEWEESFNDKETYIFCPNHTSTLDIPFVLSVIPIPLQFMGKKEISKIPIFGYFCKKNSIIVDRSKKRDSYLAFVKASNKLDKGHNVCIFPEGGIPKTNVLLKNFKNGAFKLAIEKNIKIVPITIPDNKFIFPSNYFQGHPGIARIKIHKPIDPNKIKDAKKLNIFVYNIILNQLKEYGKSN